MYTLILVIHFLACILLILSVLMQSGKGSAAGIFGGGGGSDALFAGPTAFNFLNRFTAVVAITLFCTSITLTVLTAKRGASSVVDNVKVPVTQTQPVNNNK
ncbi:Pre-protein translocase, SecG subunit [Elusimicrobium minutum Pei191]|uniref:Protein-export membrane protein SecG n=1 Tax=Elusimicrobium minutum (strain Pei191) TaxID=445932 RepID=B2KDY5_ELUMP|nr:preprotein translocase subunit SecG [Elusimicrobium minutum]ACC98731.1 Pre-protein translocase, SecG subunit [Elusimicrobium minutum Pei191]